MRGRQIASRKQRTGCMDREDTPIVLEQVHIGPPSGGLHQCPVMIGGVPIAEWRVMLAHREQDMRVGPEGDHETLDIYHELLVELEHRLAQK